MWLIAIKFLPNLAVRNRNENILNFLNEQKAYNGRVAAFSSWNVLPFILDEKMNGMPVNSGYEYLEETDDEENILINQVQKNIVHKTNTRHDLLTYASAKTYIEQKHPRVLFLGLGETFTTNHTVNNAIPLKPVEIIREKTSFPNMASLNK